MNLLKTIALAAAMLLPMVANAGLTTDKMVKACSSNNPGCLAYTMGGADRYWLVEGKHESCDVASDKKTIETVKKAAQGKTTFYTSKQTQAAVVPLANYLGTNKLQSCALTMNFADLTAKCVSKIEGDQVTCHAYIAGVMDMALLMDRLHQKEVEKAEKPKTPFCENGAPKEQMSDPEVMAAISAYGQSTAGATAANVPAAKSIMEALLNKYSCAKAAPDKTSSTTPDKK